MGHRCGWGNRSICIVGLFFGLVSLLRGAPSIVLPGGRTVFFQDEEIVLRVDLGEGVEGRPVSFRLENASGLPSVEGNLDLEMGAGYLQIPAHLLSGGRHERDPRGAWMLRVAESERGFQVMNGIRNTPFTVGIYGGSIPDETENAFGGPGPMPVAERQRLYRDTHGVNLILHTGHWGGPANAGQADRVAGMNARLAAQHIVAGQHQPAGISTSWADPGIVEATRLKVRYQTQRWRRVAGGVLAGIHYADEPGLTWGLMSEDGTKHFTFSVPADAYYTGPFAVPAQYRQYRAETGQMAPDFRYPDRDLDAWMAFMRWRTTILGRVFAQYTEDVHAIDPNYIGFSQVYAWRTTAEGIYPPSAAKGLDVLATHGYGSWTYLGHMNPAHEVDAMRSGAWDKPLWMLGPWLGNQADRGGVPAVIYGLLARKVEGILWPLDWMRFWPESEEVSARILPISGMLYQARKPRDPVGLLHSLDQHLYTNSRHVLDANPGTPYFGHLLTAWWALQAAGHPSTRVVEEDILNGRLSSHKVLVAPHLNWIRPEIRRALEAWIEDGGRLLLDASGRLDLAGAERLPFAFENGLDESLLPRINPVVSANTAVAYERLIEPIVEPLRASLSSVPVAFQSDSPHVLKGVYDGGRQARYFWAVNQKTSAHPEAQMVPEALVATLDFGHHEGVLFDVFARKELPSLLVREHFGPGDGRVYALLPEVPDAPQVQALVSHSGLDLASEVYGRSGRRIRGVIPLEVSVWDPEDELVFRVWRATDAEGQWRETFPLGQTTQPGRYRIQVLETVSGTSVEAGIDLAARSLQLDQTGAVGLLDRAQIDRFFARTGEVLILFGTVNQEKQARHIAERLRAAGRPARAAAAEDFTEQQKIVYDGAHFDFFGGLYNTPTLINRDVIVLGAETDNESMRRLVEQYHLVPFDLATYGPGTGQALVWWSTAAFGLESMSVAVYARDEAGLQRGVDVLLARIAAAAQ